MKFLLLCMYHFDSYCYTAQPMTCFNYTCTMELNVHIKLEELVFLEFLPTDLTMDRT